ncbi:MAG: helix-turn-helix domain-containing protein [Chloroflexi bacterium]|nr:helix-turn-helix domain-containing protein [Chloroflexota bacterium]OJV97533.1 MAG: hypothetical protein BGO39_07130 [Chloroflexi bacterium 54-19]
MTGNLRVGFQLIPDDPFWIEIGMTIDRQAHLRGLDLVSLDLDAAEVPGQDYTAILEEILAHQIRVLIFVEIPQPLIRLLTANNIPLISLVSQLGCHTGNCHHPNITSPVGMFDIARMGAEFILERLQGQGNVLAVGGLSSIGEDGRTLLDGVTQTLAPYPGITFHHIPTFWRRDLAYPQIVAGLKALSEPPAAIFGFSDSVALAARSAAEELGLLKPDTLVVGNNGEPQALAAIVRGKMAATVQVPTGEFAGQVIDIACRALKGEPVPRHYYFRPVLITAVNVAEAAVDKLTAISEMPDQLIGVNRRREQQHLTHIETSLAINRQVGAILNRWELTRKIVDQIRQHFDYSQVNLYFFSESERVLLLDGQSLPDNAGVLVGAAENEVFARALDSGDLVYVPDVRLSQRFTPDYNWPELRTRVVLPVRFGDKLLCLLDLHSNEVRPHTREQLMGLKALADQLAVAIQNAELYSEALTARKVAEKADKLKTLVLANVSHEFRTPLNIILGYTKEALNSPNPYGIELPAELTGDLGRIYRSGEHMLRLISDLLDLSRAEIDELEIFPEFIDIRASLEEVFQSVAGLTPARPAVKWRFVAPPNLPLMQVDPSRLRQIILNLLSNAQKFTETGEVILAVDVKPPYLHIRVEDTGPGISLEQQETIFEPFVVGENSGRISGGIGLGLSITRHLVSLHRGYITLDSEPGRGSTFNVYLPLPNLTGQLTAQLPGEGQALVCISRSAQLPAEIAELVHRFEGSFVKIGPSEVSTVLQELSPSILAWDATDMSDTDWLAMDILRNHPRLAQLPLILYGNIASEEHPSSFTNILLKPLSGQTLSTILTALRPQKAQGSVLIVDDDHDSLDLYKQLVTTALPGHSIYRAENGQMALDILQDLTPSLVILDVFMPEIDGIRVVDWLRANPSTQHVPILVISGKTLTAEHIKHLDHPRLIYQPKDILKFEEVTDTLKQVASGTTLLSQYNSILVKRTVNYLQDNYARPITLPEIAQAVGTSKNNLSEIFHQEMRISIWQFLNRYRIKQARHLLETSDLSVAAIATMVGFEDPAYFSRVFHSITNQSPKAYRLDFSHRS